MELQTRNLCIIVSVSFTWNLYIILHLFICIRLFTDKASILQHFKTKKSGAACHGHLLPILPGVHWDQQYPVLCACHISSHRIWCRCLSILGCHHGWLLVDLHIRLNCYCGSMGPKDTPTPGWHSNVHLSGMESVNTCKQKK